MTQGASHVVDFVVEHSQGSNWRVCATEIGEGRALILLREPDDAAVNCVRETDGRIVDRAFAALPNCTEAVVHAACARADHISAWGDDVSVAHFLPYITRVSRDRRIADPLDALPIEYVEAYQELSQRAPLSLAHLPERQLSNGQTLRLVSPTELRGGGYAL